MKIKKNSHVMKVPEEFRKILESIKKDNKFIIIDGKPKEPTYSNIMRFLALKEKRTKKEEKILDFGFLK